jgi:uncharacterized protein YutE (UPF0331/DUF86 family)
MIFSTIFVSQKLQLIKNYTQELKTFLNQTTDKEFFNNFGKMYIAERLVQLIVDGMIDINQHFIRELNLNISEDLQGTFIIMGESSILPKIFAKKIAPVVGVRNILVHQYEDLDKKMFLRNLRKHFSDFEKYQKYIVQYLKKHQ